MTRRIGYCTNVHAGPDLAQTRANLETHALAVKARVSPDAPMGIGLWLAAPAARTLAEDDHALESFSDWLAEKGLLPFTLNGFPYGDFHQPVVKHRVYEPTWHHPDRLAYTRNLIHVLHAILPDGEVGSISTLPLAWGNPAPSFEQLDQCGESLAALAGELARLESDSGRLIHLGLEPEPGCAIQRSDDVVHFFEGHLLHTDNEALIRRHIRVCHDICHAAVMFEGQEDVLTRYRNAGIGLSKVQVSSAITADFGAMHELKRRDAIDQIASFSEDRYLHQTCVQGVNGAVTFHEDLPAALNTVTDPTKLDTRWAIHFHVPIYLERFGRLGTSRAQIRTCLEAVGQDADHFEVETYAWGVLPEAMRRNELAVGIAEEIAWFTELLDSL